MATLRICHLGKYYPPAPGGIETHVRTLAQAQAAAGADVHVVCVNHRDARGSDVTGRRLAVTQTVEESDGPVRVTRLGRCAAVSRFDVCPALPRALSGVFGKGCDVLHLHTPNPVMLVALASIKAPAPLVIGYHSDVVRQKALWLAMRPLERRVFRSAARILAASPGYRDGSPVLRQYADKVDLLPYGLDLSPYLTPSPRARRFAEQLRQEHGEPLWLCVGRLVYYKGLGAALEALPRVPGKLLVVGGGPLLPELKRKAQSLGIVDRVLWLGNLDQDDLVGAYQAASALWFPSNARSEAFGLVQVEAMASGCPVINTAIERSGVSWVSRDDETGITISVNDPEALAAAARRLIERPELRASYAQAARRRAIDQFAAEAMAQRSLIIYEGLRPARRQAA